MDNQTTATEPDVKDHIIQELALGKAQLEVSLIEAQFENQKLKAQLSKLQVSQSAGD